MQCQGYKVTEVTDAKFRLGMFPINVELGRYKIIPREQRIRPVCDLDQVEDELHVLFYCTAHNKEIYLIKLTLLIWQNMR